MSKSLSSSSESPIAPRLKALRGMMREQNLDAILVRSTDRFLNEYVAPETSTRAYITGFKGSVGDAIITGDRALLFVDGRYTLQASQQAPDFEASTVPLGTSIEEGWLQSLRSLEQQGIRRMGIETDRIEVALFQKLKKRAQELGIALISTVPSLVDDVRAELGPQPTHAQKKKVWPVDSALTGAKADDRLARARSALEKHRLDGFVVVPLDEIAWLANLRGSHFPYQATFPARAIAYRGAAQGEIVIEGPKAGGHLDVNVLFLNSLVRDLQTRLKSRANLRLGYDPHTTPEFLRNQLSQTGAVLLPCTSPFRPLRTTKTRAEIVHMADGFARADDVVKKVQAWVKREVDKGETVTEVGVAKRVEKTFKRSGAWGLSFRVISAAGKNGAVIHYSSTDDTTPLKKGDLFLLDTGGYYEGGYATDLTRTFLVGGPKTEATAKQKELFTVTLKGAIAGMSARFPVGTTGEQLDAIVRDPIWRAGYRYAHGTGHGVGVNVHEFPPRVAPGVRAHIEEGHVFSIEPGIYLDGYGGVRIENLVTCVKDPEDDRFLRIKPLTFSPFDKRLIDKSRLTKHEVAFLKWFSDGAKHTTGEARLAYELPPLSA